ncbi:Hypothetical protein R9X50_00338700 [Acrodontium crateriforme]|uniref:Uncharacterized protein n=1 Tax=Acrodontium crateriforme TaxID=150365 RepID=A0AAQ3M8Y4_9PEZI|nr:Hypothetical protein R9X50_00338700 [Acrodontium crateriforme]
MFGVTGLYDAAIDTDEERDPPKSPTAVTFPVFDVPRKPVNWDCPASLPDFESVYTKVNNPKAVRQGHVDLLNIQIQESCSFNDMVPFKADGESYLPPANPAPLKQDSSAANEVADKERKLYDYRLTELRLDNETGFGSLSGQRISGIKRPQVSYTRSFWMGLESMSPYWDCSLDNYYTTTTPVEDTKPSKRPRLGGDSDDEKEATAVQSESELTVREEEVTFAGEDVDDSAHAAATGPSSSSNDRMKSASTELRPKLTTTMRYKGRRTHTGREMPDMFREKTVIAFVEAIVWPFKSALKPPRNNPVVQFGRFQFPVRQNATVNLMPTDRDKARKGWITGPIMGVQVRPELDFSQPGTDENNIGEKASSRLDQVREISGLLQLAQERRREGKTEVIPGEGKWWTTTPRWGGGPPLNPPNYFKDVAQQAIQEVMNGTLTANEADRRIASSTPESIRRWANIRKSSPKWDSRTEYKAVGKDPNSPFDEVFMVSSLNHHICILKLSIHGTYTDTLSSGRFPDSIPAENKWCQPIMQRSQWFDLFDVEQRVLAFRMLWGVMTYLTRTMEGDEEESKAAEIKTAEMKAAETMVQATEKEGQTPEKEGQTTEKEAMVADKEAVVAEKGVPVGEDPQPQNMGI